MNNALFHLLLDDPGRDVAKVCPENPIPAVSAWAESVLGFQPEPRQREVLDLDAHRLILCCARQWGKTVVAAVKALHSAIYHPNTEIVVISCSVDQAGILIGRVRVWAARLGLPRRRVLGHEHSLELPNGSKLYAVANEKDAARGYTATIVIVDEAARVSDEVLAAVVPTLTRTDGQLWLLSTPNGQSGLFYNVWHERAHRDWRRVKATIEDFPYATPAFIAEQRRLFPLTFRQEYYCEFTPARGRIFNRGTLDGMLDESLAGELFPLFCGGNR